MRKRKIDWYVLIPVLLMMCVGIIMVLSASSPTTVLGKDHDTYIFFRKQLIWLGFGLVAMFFTANYNYRKWRKFVIPAAVLTVVLLLAVFGFKAKNGAHSWIPIGDNQFQPSEFVKLCVILI
ncbi:MAG: FtsW/RodA/SpoVE family cell cycle protein, partial [Eubacteriales bacterium]